MLALFLAVVCSLVAKWRGDDGLSGPSKRGGEKRLGAIDDACRGGIDVWLPAVHEQESDERKHKPFASTAWFFLRGFIVAPHKPQNAQQIEHHRYSFASAWAQSMVERSLTIKERTWIINESLHTPGYVALLLFFDLQLKPFHSTDIEL